MLLIAVGHGFSSDPFTCSITCYDPNVDAKDSNACLNYLCHNMYLEPMVIDEILVVMDNVVKYHYWL